MGQACLVTGASSGIGRAIALRLAAAGAAVHAVSRHRDTLQETARLAGSSQIAIYAADVTVDEEVDALTQQFETTGLDVLVHSAGAFSLGTFEQAPVEELDLQYRTNVRAPYRLTQRLLPALKANAGQIVFINSTVGLVVRANVSQFAATQHALKALADGLREEINPAGVRVVSVYPGRTATARQARIYELEGRDYAPESLMQADDVAATVMTALTLPRTAELTDVRVRPMRKH